MVALERAEIEMTANISGSSRTGTFVILGGEEGQAQFQQQGRTGYLLQGTGSTAVSLLQEAFDSDEPKRKGIFFDFGGGQHTFSLTWTLVEGMTDESGNTPQWGSSASSSLNTHTATGQDPRSQAAVFMEYWRNGQYDSRNPATFRWWDYSSGGEFSELSVAMEQPTFTASAGEPTVTGSITLIEMATSSDAIDALQRTLP